MIPNTLYYENHEYVHISVLSQILANIDLKKFWKNFKNDRKLQIIDDNTYSSISDVLKNSDTPLPLYLKPLSQIYYFMSDIDTNFCGVDEEIRSASELYNKLDFNYLFYVEKNQLRILLLNYQF